MAGTKRVFSFTKKSPRGFKGSPTPPCKSCLISLLKPKLVPAETVVYDEFVTKIQEFSCGVNDFGVIVFIRTERENRVSELE